MHLAWAWFWKVLGPPPSALFLGVLEYWLLNIYRGSGQFWRRTLAPAGQKRCWQMHGKAMQKLFITPSVAVPLESLGLLVATPLFLQAGTWALVYKKDCELQHTQLAQLRMRSCLSDGPSTHVARQLTRSIDCCRQPTLMLLSLTVP